MPYPVLLEILTLVSQRRGIDFRDYRRDTLRRRALSRVRATGCTDLAAYRSYLMTDRDEVDRLVETLVVPVTEFFRDAWTFRELDRCVLPTLARQDAPTRAWVIGAATGEEAYTLAILLAEASTRGTGSGFEMIASDLDRRSLEVARAGVYPAAAAVGIPHELYPRYFRSNGSGIRIADSLRDRIQFAEHDLVGPYLAPREAIVAAFDIVLCRNVLLYFDAPLRAKAVARLAAVLEPGNVLMVGHLETLPAEAERHFQPYPGANAGAGILARRAP
jgi:two-component system, chemotaxis family, CheB/CheR fusion protein